MEKREIDQIGSDDEPVSGATDPTLSKKTDDLIYDLKMNL